MLVTVICNMKIFDVVVKVASYCVEQFLVNNGVVENVVI